MMVAKQSDLMESLISRSEVNAIKGIGPKNKQSQDDIFDIIGEKETLEIVDAVGKKVDPFVKNGQIEWDQIKDMSKGHLLMQKPVEQWSVRQLFMHFKNLFYHRYGCDIVDIGDLSAYEVIRKMREEFCKMTDKSRVTPVFIKKYMEWYVESFLDSSIAKKGGFKIHSIRTKASMLKFVRSYSEDLDKETAVTVISKPEPIVTKDIDAIYASNKITFLMNYGIVTGINWLVVKKGFSIEKSMKIVSDLLGDAKKEDKSVMAQILKSTFIYSPYPKSYEINGIKKLLDLVTNSDSGMVSFAETSKGYF